MPIYLFQHPKNKKKTIEVILSVHEEHVYVDDKGVKWQRIFTVPQAATNTKIDEFSQSQFEDKIDTTKGTLGDVWDRSAELSAKRADRAGGVDPIKQKHYDDYAKKRKGKRNIQEIKENADKTFVI